MKIFWRLYLWRQISVKITLPTFYLEGKVALFGGYGCVIWEVWLRYLGGMVVLFGGYGLHYEVW